MNENKRRKKDTDQKKERRKKKKREKIRGKKPLKMWPYFKSVSFSVSCVQFFKEISFVN